MKRRPICPTCQREMACKKNGVWVVDMQPYDTESPEPVRLTSTDLFCCAGCGAQVIAGSGDPVLSPVDGNSTPEAIIAYLAKDPAPNVCYVYNQPENRLSAERTEALGLPRQTVGPGEVKP